MPAAEPGPCEPERLAALTALNILDTVRSGEFDIFPALARQIFSVPIAAIFLVDKERQWAKASVGLGELTEMPREVSFCAHAILSPDSVLYVPDATQDPRFADNALVTGEFGLRFYAGAPIIDPSGYAQGSLCLIDRVPRQMNEAMLEQLRQLALGVSSALKLHASVDALERIATTDPLTELNNRTGFDQVLRAAFERGAARASATVSLLMLDLDNFKAINDVFGHAGGDAALQEVARRLRRVVPAGASINRLGGDEFCIIVESIQDKADLETLCDRIHAALAEPFAIDQQDVPLRTSIGITTRKACDADPVALTREVDAALHQAKRTGRGTTRFADQTDDPNKASALAGRQTMQQLLREALFPPGHEPFALALQPIFKGATGELDGFEALVRWPTGDGAVRMPGEFIPAAEVSGMIVQIDRWVLDQVCAVASTWPDGLHISSNLSAANFLGNDLLDQVAAALDRHALPANRLKLEITETVLLHNGSHVVKIITGLRRLGVQVILDDFGVGHSSIGYLRDYPFDGLKIDRSFTAGLETDRASRAFTRAIITMANALDLSITAEGVETQGQVDRLRHKGVTFMQGYYLGRPMSSEAAQALIARSRNQPDIPRTALRTG